MPRNYPSFYILDVHLITQVTKETSGEISFYFNTSLIRFSSVLFQEKDAKGKRQYYLSKLIYIFSRKLNFLFWMSSVDFTRFSHEMPFVCHIKMLKCLILFALAVYTNKLRVKYRSKVCKPCTWPSYWETCLSFLEADHPVHHMFNKIASFFVLQSVQLLWIFRNRY
jgi:hypothetical protein